MRVLCIGGQNLSSVSVEVLVSGFLSLEKLKIFNCSLRTKQLTQLFSNASNNTNIFLRESLVFKEINGTFSKPSFSKTQLILSFFLV